MAAKMATKMETKQQRQANTNINLKNVLACDGIMLQPFTKRFAS
jgi:hypothetical protein